MFQTRFRKHQMNFSSHGPRNPWLFHLKLKIIYWYCWTKKFIFSQKTGVDTPCQNIVPSIHKDFQAFGCRLWLLALSSRKALRSKTSLRHLVRSFSIWIHLRENSVKKPRKVEGNSKRQESISEICEFEQNSEKMTRFELKTEDLSKSGWDWVKNKFKMLSW